MISSIDSRQPAQRTGRTSAGTPAHPALRALARLLGRQAAKEAVRVKETRTEDEPEPSSEDGGPTDV